MSPRAPYYLLLALLAATGCKSKASGSTTEAKAPAAATAGETAESPAAGGGEFAAEVAHVRRGWIGTIASDPSVFSKLTSTSPGWAEFFKGEIRRASRTFGRSLDKVGPEGDAAKRAILRVGQGRSLLRTAEVFAHNASLSVELLVQYFDERSSRRPKGVVAKPSERLYHGVGLVLGGDREAGMKHIEAVVAEGEAAGPFRAQALAWKGFVAQISGADGGGEAPWKLATEGGVEAADLVAYLTARAGGKATDLAGGTPMRDRLKVGVSVYRGDLKSAEQLMSRIEPRAPDQVDSIPALDTDSDAGAAELRYFSPVLLDDLARLYGRRAVQVLDGVGGCADYWLGLAHTIGGDKDNAMAALGRLTGSSGATPAAAEAAPGAAPAPTAAKVDSAACLMFSPFQDEEDLAADAKVRQKALRGEAKNLTPDDKLLVRKARHLAVTLGAMKKRPEAKKMLAQLEGIPEDGLPIVTAIQEGLAGYGTEEGRNLVRKLRFVESYANSLVRTKAAVSALLGDYPGALSLYEASHDEQQSDKVSSINRPGYLLATGDVNWKIKRHRRANQHIEMLSGRFPELWQNIEFMKRVDAIAAVGDRSAPVMGN